MKRMNQGSMCISGLLVGLFMVGSNVGADTYIKQVTNTLPIKTSGQEIPGKSDTVELWMTKDKAYMKNADGNGTLYIAGENKMYLINHQQKTIADIKVDGAGVDLSSLMDPDLMEQEEGAKPLTEEEKAYIREMGSKMSALSTAFLATIKYKVTPTSEVKMIREWNTKKYDYTIDMAGMKSTGSTWASEDVNVDYMAYHSLTFCHMAASPGFDDVVAEAMKIKGFPVYSESAGEAMGVKVNVIMEVLEIATKTAPVGTYDMPSTYKQGKGKKK